MKKVRGFSLGARLGFGILAGLQAGWSCSCIDVWREWGVQVVVDGAAWVFVGEALGEPSPIPEAPDEDTLLSGLTHRQSLRVLREGKGPRAGDTVVVLEEFDERSTCSYALPLGEPMLVVADRRSGLVSLHLCGGSRGLVEQGIGGGVDEAFVQEVLAVASAVASVERPGIRPKSAAQVSVQAKGRAPLCHGTVPGHINVQGRRPLLR